MVIKLIAYREYFFKESWNNFDAVVVIGSFIGIILTEFTTIDVGTSTFVLRAFRIIRVLKFFRSQKSLQLIA